MIITIYLIGFVLSLTGIIATCKVALDIIHTYEVKKAAKMTVNNRAAVSIQDNHNSLMSQLHTQKMQACHEIELATTKKVLSVQKIIEKRAYELKQLIALKREIEDTNAQNRAAEQKAYKAKQRADIAELNAQNRASIRLREMAMTV